MEVKENEKVVWRVGVKTDGQLFPEDAAFEFGRSKVMVEL